MTVLFTSTSKAFNNMCMVMTALINSGATMAKVPMLRWCLLPSRPEYENWTKMRSEINNNNFFNEKKIRLQMIQYSYKCNMITMKCKQYKGTI